MSKPNIVTFTHDDKKAKGLFSKVEKINGEILKVLEKATDIEGLLNQINAVLTTVGDAHVKKRIFRKSELLELGKRYSLLLEGDRKLKGTRLEHYLAKEPVFCSKSEEATFEVIQKYFYNDAFQNLFPFTEANTFDKSFIWLVIRASILYYGLSYYVGSADNLHEVASFVSAFSKGIEHHHDFKEKAIKMF